MGVGFGVVAYFDDLTILERETGKREKRTQCALRTVIEGRTEKCDPRINPATIELVLFIRIPKITNRQLPMQGGKRLDIDS